MLKEITKGNMGGVSNNPSVIFLRKCHLPLHKGGMMYKENPPRVSLSEESNSLLLWEKGDHASGG